jgi:hypothetical protein
LLLGVGPKSSSTQTKLSEHKTNRGEAEKSERVSGEIFEILGQPAAAIKPSESAFDILVIRTGPARTAPLGSSFQLSGKFACHIEAANRPCPHGICEPPVKRYAMQIVFDIGILICHHVFVSVGKILKGRTIL